MVNSAAISALIVLRGASLASEDYGEHYCEGAQLCQVGRSTGGGNPIYPETDVMLVPAIRWENMQPYKPEWPMRDIFKNEQED